MTLPTQGVSFHRGTRTHRIAVLAAGLLATGLSFVERELNSTRTQTIANVDLKASGATQAQVARGLRELSDHGILAAGRSTTVIGPAGTADGFAASEFYLRVTSGR